jgi:AraC-like DNA-binding protein
MSVTDIALSLGFSDPTAFSRAFRRWTGVSPIQYRESARSTPPNIPSGSGTP